MRPVKGLKKGLWYGIYDFGNSGYYLVYCVLVFPLFLSQTAFSSDEWFEAKWGAAQGAAVAAAVLFGLLLGTRLDRLPIRALSRTMMLVAAVVSLLVPFLIWLEVGGAELLFGYAVVHGVYLLSLTIYDATLPSVAGGQEAVAVSGWAWGLGYLGGITCIALMEAGVLLGVYERYSVGHFLTASSFFIGLSVVAAAFVPAPTPLEGPLRDRAERIERSGAGPRDTQGFALQMARWKLLLIFLLAVEGIAIFMAFFSLYCSRGVGLSDAEITKMLVVLQVLAFPLTGLVTLVASHRLSGVLIACGCIWIVAVCLVVIAPGRLTIWLSVIAVAFVVGSTQALLRAIYANSVSRSQAVAGFSTYAVVEKGAAFIGPLVAGTLIVALGYRWVISLAGLLVLLACVMLGSAFRRREAKG